ncbi:MAG TPA: HupE/UreJ family protein, partial [Chitinophagaceae bacterium]|nr:HupE/UreJ family protein [Chitinophagaceae bacterium]
MQDFSFYFGLGWHHIISLDALDHILFIIALAAIYVLSDWKQVLVLVTAFTLGHSITLALSVYDILRFQAKWVEFLIPCTIVVTAISNLFQPRYTQKTIQVNYYLALFFGLIHGMGFANAIRFILAEDQHLGWSLFAFNIGLEAGQVIVVFFLLVISLVVINNFKVNRKHWVVFLSAGVFSLAL